VLIPDRVVELSYTLMSHTTKVGRFNSIQLAPVLNGALDLSYPCTICLRLVRRYQEALQRIPVVLQIAILYPLHRPAKLGRAKIGRPKFHPRLLKATFTSALMRMSPLHDLQISTPERLITTISRGVF